MNRFTKFGGATAREIYGYFVPDDAKTYDDWSKDEAAPPVYREWFVRLRRVPTCSLVADWLNASGVPTGPYCRGKRWDGKMVRRLTRNPLLKGSPGRGFRHTVKHHETGRRASVTNPARARFKGYPHLAHVEPTLWDEVNTLLEKANRNRGRRPTNGSYPRPGQHITCGVCRRLYYWDGHGQNDHMMCSGSRKYCCWNAVAFNGHDASRNLVRAVLAEIERLPDFDPEFLAKV